MDNCTCGNPKFNFDCVCEWVAAHPGNLDFTCEFCGIYTAGEARCNKCEVDENLTHMNEIVAGLITCRYCGQPFDTQLLHSTCGLE